MPGRGVRGPEKCLKEMQCVDALTWVGIALKLAACSSISRAPFHRPQSTASCPVLSNTKWKVLTSNKTNLKREKVTVKTRGNCDGKHLQLQSSDRAEWYLENVCTGKVVVEEQ